MRNVGFNLPNGRSDYKTPVRGHHPGCLPIKAFFVFFVPFVLNDARS